jgi:hypothetical protein
VLFEKARIQTSWVDQTSPGSVATLARAVPDDLDLIVDDASTRRTPTSRS